jgi:hypothetical protein
MNEIKVIDERSAVLQEFVEYISELIAENRMLKEKKYAIRNRFF